MKKIYEVVIEKRVRKKDLKAVPAKDKLRIFERIYELANDPYPKGCTKLENYKPATYRVRQGTYRILYRVHDDVLQVLVVEVGHRRDVYRR